MCWAFAAQQGRGLAAIISTSWGGRTGYFRCLSQCVSPQAAPTCSVHSESGCRSSGVPCCGHSVVIFLHRSHLQPLEETSDGVLGEEGRHARGMSVRTRVFEQSYNGRLRPSELRRTVSLGNSEAALMWEATQSAEEAQRLEHLCVLAGVAWRCGAAKTKQSRDARCGRVNHGSDPTCTRCEADQPR